MTTNKEDALRSFVDRKEEALRAKKAKVAELLAVHRKDNAELPIQEAAASAKIEAKKR